MTQSEAVNKMAMEMSHALGDFSHLKTCKFYLNMAITIGTEHFTRTMEEVVAMTFEGKEIGRFKSITDASDDLGILKGNIQGCIHGRRHSAGGLLFMKSSDKELIKR